MDTFCTRRPQKSFIGREGPLGMWMKRIEQLIYFHDHALINYCYNPYSSNLHNSNIDLQ